MQTWRISLATTIALFLGSGCSITSGSDPEPGIESIIATSTGVAASTGPLLRYEGAYIREHPVVRILYWRTATGLAVSAQTKAIAGPIASASINSSYYDWLKAEYTTPATLSPTGVSLVPNRGSLGGQIESINGLANLISDSDIRGQIALELGNGNLGPHSSNTSTDNQLMVLVVVPASVSVRNIGANASSSDVPYHDNTLGADSIAYIVVRDDGNFAANASAGLVSAALNPYADFNLRAWQSGFLSVPFREVGCFGVGATVPVLDAASGITVTLAPLYSNAQAACIGPPQQITDTFATPVQATQVQNVAAGGHPGPFTFFVTNRSVAAVSLSGGASCAFSPGALGAGTVGRVDCPSPQLVTLAASFGSTVYRTSMSLTVSCPDGFQFDGATCVPVVRECDCPCGCNARGVCIRCPICNPKLGCDP
jgi:hypothetical protein